MELFDWRYYLEIYPDLMANGIHTEQQALQHWQRHGKDEGRKSYYNTIDTNIVIFDNNKLTYNIGDLLNMPYFFAHWKSNPHATIDQYNLFCKTADEYSDSILHIYKTSRITDGKEDENIPNPHRLRNSVDVYGKNIDIIRNIDDSTTLYVHIRSGDMDVIENGFIDIIYKLYIKQYKNIIILAGIHNDIRFGSKQNNINKLKLSLIKLNNKCIKYSINYDTPDNHLYIMRTCRNLLVHKGGFSVIGALIFNGDNLYITGFFNPLNVTDNHNNNFFSHIKKYELV